MDGFPTEYFLLRRVRTYTVDAVLCRYCQLGNLRESLCPFFAERAPVDHHVAIGGMALESPESRLVSLMRHETPGAARLLSSLEEPLRSAFPRGPLAGAFAAITHRDEGLSSWQTGCHVHMGAPPAFGARW